MKRRIIFLSVAVIGIGAGVVCFGLARGPAGKDGTPIGHLTAASQERKARQPAALVPPKAVRESENALGTDRVGKNLRALFALAEQAKRDPSGLAKQLAELDRDPAFARSLIEEGLHRLPHDQTSAVDRAGLLDLSLRYADGNKEWAIGVLTAELTQVPAEARLPREEVKSVEDQALALSVTPEILRVQVAYSDLVKLHGKDCGALVAATTDILNAQSDGLLKENLGRELRGACPEAK